MKPKTIFWVYIFLPILGVLNEELSPRRLYRRDGPEIVTRPQTFIKNVNETVILPCEVKNLGDSVVVWMMNGQVDQVISAGNVIATRDPTVKLVNGFDLEVHDIRVRHFNRFSCLIGVPFLALETSSVTHTIKRKENEVEPTVFSQDQTFKVAVNDTVILPCEAINVGNRERFWIKGNNEFWALTEDDILILSDERLNIIDGYNLKIERVRPNDSDLYKCRIGNFKTIKHRLIVS